MQYVHSCQRQLCNCCWGFSPVTASNESGFALKVLHFHVKDHVAVPMAVAAPVTTIVARRYSWSYYSLKVVYKLLKWQT